MGKRWERGKGWWDRSGRTYGKAGAVAILLEIIRRWGNDDGPSGPPAKK
jgi:hypothetical protein